MITTFNFLGEDVDKMGGTEADNFMSVSSSSTCTTMTTLAKLAASLVQPRQRQQGDLLLDKANQVSCLWQL